MLLAKNIGLKPLPSAQVGEEGQTLTHTSPSLSWTGLCRFPDYRYHHLETDNNVALLMREGDPQLTAPIMVKVHWLAVCTNPLWPLTAEHQQLALPSDLCHTSTDSLNIGTSKRNPPGRLQTLL